MDAEIYLQYLQTGQEDALIEIIRLYNDRLILYLNAIVCDLHAAEDLAEDTFVLLFTKKPRYKPGHSFKVWLYTIARNLALDYLRRKKKRAEVPLEDYTNVLFADNMPEASYIKKEQTAQLIQAMFRLKPQYRNVLWLTYFEGLSNKETAQVIKKSPHNVETLLYRARAALRQRLESEGYAYDTV